MFSRLTTRALLTVNQSVRCCGTSPIKVYGHYVSQPARAVLWLLKINDQPFAFTKIAALAGETRTPEFREKFPTALIPALEDGEFHVSEGSAIMIYLCEKYKWDNWYPQGSDQASKEKRAQINQYLSYHHHSTRTISREIAFKLFNKQFFNKDFPESMDDLKALSSKILHNFEKKCLYGGPFIGGFTTPTIADLFAYAEIYQLVFMDVLKHDDLSPTLQSWATSLQALPAHDDVHSTIRKLAHAMKEGRDKN